MTTASTLTSYFEEELRLAGYIFHDVSVYWSLGYCQGDGMDFAGTVTCDGVIQLYSRLVSRISEAKNARLWKALRDGAVSVSVDRISSRYHHYNTMQSEVEWDTDTLRNDYGFTTRQLARLEDFKVAVVEDVKDTSKRLQREGYKLLEACSPMWFGMSRAWKDTYIGDLPATVRTFRRGTFVVEIAMVQNDNLDIDHEDAKQLISGETVSYDLRVRITEDGDTVFEQWTCSVFDQRTAIQPFAIAREIMRDARGAMLNKASRLRQFAGHHSVEPLQAR